MTELVTRSAVLPPHLNLAVAAWLDAHKAAPLTHALYEAELGRFVAALAQAGHALDSPAGLVAIVAQAYAGAGDVKAATFNKKLAALSSFYHYAIKRELIAPPNPIEIVERRTVEPYGRSRALDLGEVRKRLDAIDRSTLVGQRDYALLTVALATGRRRAELAGLRWTHVHLLSDGRARLTWAHCKGNEQKADTLPLPLTRTLLGYLHTVYGAQLGVLPQDAAIWVSVSNYRSGGALSVSAVADVCMARLGTSKVHQLRHTFARQMEERGAKLSEIQRRLGHKSPATTGIYLEALRSDENPYAEELVRELGVG